MARLPADENFPLPVTERLRTLGHDVVTLEELGKSDRRLADEAVLRLAVEQERAVLTLNRRHFVRLHGETPDHAGIVVCSLEVDFGRQAQRITDALEAVAPIERKLVRINRPG